MPIARKVTLALFVFGLLLLPVVASAQIGVKGGINQATFKLEPATPNVGKIQGLTFGIYVPSKPNAKSKFQTEILYSEKGAKDTSTGDKLKLTYIDVAILDRIKLSGQSPVHVHFDVGPVLSYRLKVDSFPGAPTKDDIKVYDVGLAVGGDIDTGPIEIDVRYTWGMINFLKASSALPGETDKNRVLSFLIGLHSKGK